MAEGLGFTAMTSPKEIPELATELIELSKEYLRQETIEPARRLGRLAGFGLAAGLLFAVAALFLGLGVYAALRRVLPDGPWYVVLARGLTVVFTGGAAAFIGWRMTKDG